MEQFIETITRILAIVMFVFLFFFHKKLKKLEKINKENKALKEEKAKLSDQIRRKGTALTIANNRLKRAELPQVMLDE